jgi:drug/metabolite transporter (DMT)-like permease
MKFLFNLHPTIKGVGLAFLATLGMANVYVFSKAALLEVNYFQFTFYWFGFALIWNLVFMLSTGMIRKIPQLSRKSKINLVIIGLLELGAATTLFLAIQLAENPTVVSFLSNATPLFVTLFGIRFLGERFNRTEAIGMILTIGGVVMITYSRDMTLAQFFGDGSGWILVSSLFLSISIVFAKSNIRSIHPGILTINRVLFIFAFGVIALLIRRDTLMVPGNALFNMLIGSFLGPFLTGLAQYSALKFIEASRTMIIQATRGLFVLIGSMIYLSILPTYLQISGGVITIAGVIIMTLGKIKKKDPGTAPKGAKTKEVATPSPDNL